MVLQAVQVHQRRSDAQENPETVLSFKDLFLKQEEDDEESASLADILDLFLRRSSPGMLGSWWTDAHKHQFTPSNVAELSNKTGDFAGDQDRQDAGTLRDFLFPDAVKDQAVDARAVTKRLKKHVDEPVRHDVDDNQRTLILRMNQNKHTKRAMFHIEVKL